ncbi:MAG: TRASH domain-containing protein [Planctomycetes bacterium]|nr:TRASH domain-containing protein [Planctomycetota bacterium]
MKGELFGVFGLVALSVLVRGDDPSSSKDNPTGPSSGSRRSVQRALEPYNDWVDTWRGVGQPKRGSSKGAWTEEADWAWKIGRDSAGLQFEVKDSKLFQSGLLSYDPEHKKFRFTAKQADGKSRDYVGDRAEQNKLVLVSADKESDDEQRLTIQMLHADRMLLLAESKPAGQSSFSRLAEIGYTRKGGSFASGADSGPKCIVTGGRGTITVAYKGKTYYVCCTGCRQAFLDDPEGTIAEAAERAKKEEAERKKK